MTRYIIAILILSLSLTSCEDVIDVDVPTAQPRLVIEASLDWEKGTTGNEQTIMLSMSTPYFETDQNTSVTNATVTVTNDDTGDVFSFTNQNDGTYTTTSFMPILNNTYSLEVFHNGETYEATETLMSVSDINDVTQSTEGGFDDELLELNLYFDDPANVENHYLIKYDVEGDMFPYLEARSDEFVDGNEIHDFFEKDDDEDGEETPFEAGDVVNISLYGISEQYYNFMRLLIEQYDSQGDPFSSNAAQVRGNCINPTHPENYAFGYFRVTQVDKQTYTFQ
ncbi:DUF4249 domain-containing protein [Mangrovimonas spongiae]|uniref:DUF4249 domain-containing protein n=1 Tax=Mangrovimonas spongiae TaxID=2494697 RepID=A0A428K538_9FLAO|nr:DUF4249 domain-containing protein [Mangrovimonas spongiae]RSK41536.1 DUF4249 domain-containing protein [Mangrovimonas spongiae]